MGLTSSKPKRPRITESDRALLELKAQRRKLTAERERIDAVIDRETVAAKTLLLQGKRREAALCLKKRKLQEQLVEKVDGFLFNLERTMLDLEDTRRNAELVATLKKGSSVLKQLQDELRVEDVERLMEEREGHREWLDEIEAAMASAGGMEEVNEAAQAELDAMEKEMADAVGGQLPDVPAKAHVAPRAEGEAATQANQPQSAADANAARQAVPA
ncbi:unnamed protein product [Pedinophyceae sp. YPF-701]|nr:unnamed protein product [Pedinophyceae sp. YPF-701]